MCILSNACYFAPHKSISKAASRSVQPFFAQLTAEYTHTSQSATHLSRQKCPRAWGIWTPLPRVIRASLGPPEIHNPNDMSIGSAVFARLTFMTDRLTDRSTNAIPSVPTGRIYIHSTVAWSSGRTSVFGRCTFAVLR